MTRCATLRYRRRGLIDYKLSYGYQSMLRALQGSAGRARCRPARKRSRNSSTLLVLMPGQLIGMEGLEGVAAGRVMFAPRRESRLG